MLCKVSHLFNSEGSVIVDFVLSVNLKQNGNLETAKEKLRKEVVSAWIGTLSVDPNYFETFEGGISLYYNTLQ